MRLVPLLVFCASALLSGCELLGIESPEKLAALKEADGKAVGSACRHAGRAIEDCYLLNATAQRAAVFAGWREMDEYMRDNKLDPVRPTVAHPDAPVAELGAAAAPVPASAPGEPKAAKGQPDKS
jgi:hypothetical protein